MINNYKGNKFPIKNCGGGFCQKKISRRKNLKSFVIEKRIANYGK